MKKILYIMHVDWRWIKQRPHFIIEGLAEKFEVTALYQYRYNNKTLQKRQGNDNGVKINPIFVIPKGDKYRFLKGINNLIKKIVVNMTVRQSLPDFMITTFPDQFFLIPPKFEGSLIYDCMDNHVAFISNEEQRQIMQHNEAKLIERSDIILVSSEKLKTVLIERYGIRHLSKIFLIRNGYNGNIIDKKNITNQIQCSNEDDLLITYVGTISTWFDFDLLQKSLADFKNLRYEIIGPIIDGINVPRSDRIKYIGIVEHEMLNDFVENADCLIMPFKVNEIIESVDPVKLYEYINFNKNILTVRYKEIERFQPFVHFYSDYDSYKEQIQSLLDNKSLVYTQEERCKFLNKNNWKNRIDEVVKILNYRM